MPLPFSNETPALAAVMKREERYIVEWVAWHRLQGFELYIADNGGEAQTELLKKLERANYIHYVDARDLLSRPQMPAYSRLFRRALRAGHRYIGYLDGDEFFEPLAGDPFGGAKLVRDLLKRPKVYACAFRWAIFGSETDCEDIDVPVTRRFQHRGSPEDWLALEIKSFARCDVMLKRMFRRIFPKFRYAMSKPHWFRVRAARYSLDGDAWIDYPHRKGEWKLARIRHYSIKTPAEFANKVVRGDAQHDDGINGVNENTASVYFSDRDTNDHYDPLDPLLFERLEAMIEQIKGDVGPVHESRGMEVIAQRHTQSSATGF